MVVTCPLCGYRFDSDRENVCASCPIDSDCEKICCPNCRYGWIESSSLISILSGIFRKGLKDGKS